MSDTTITSSNSVFLLSQSDLFPAPVQMQGFASDKAFATEAVELAEVQMGVDGIMTAGYTPVPVKQTISLMADSPSKQVFTSIIQATKQQRDIFYVNGVITLPATGETFTLTKGVLTTAKQISDAEKVLKETDFVITWQSVDASII